MTDTDLSLRARFERFPATVKGAFVVRGEDADPHQVLFLEARVVEVSGDSARPIPMRPAVVDCPPHQDMFLPFEFPVADLGPGWYDLECDLDVDGSRRTVQGGRRLVVQWPRATVRRGAVAIGKDLSLGEATVRLDRVDCSGDHADLRYSVSPVGSIGLRLLVDGERLRELAAEFDEETGAGVVTTYPLLRSHAGLRIEASARGVGSAGEDVPLP